MRKFNHGAAARAAAGMAIALLVVTVVGLIVTLPPEGRRYLLAVVGFFSVPIVAGWLFSKVD
jgi:hypothetical protein